MSTEPAPDDDTVLTAFPDAAIDHDNVAFYRGLLDRQFLANRCLDCAHWHTPARPICPRCWSSRTLPTEISGRGVVYMVTWLHQRSSGHGDVTAPFAMATIELAEQPGLRISTMMTGCENEDLHIGLAVELDWVERNGVPTPVFRPAPPSGSTP